MKTNWIRTLTLSAMAFTMGSAAYAQSHMVAEIPFSFRMNGTELPAGNYSIQRPTSARNVLMFTDGKNHGIAMGIANREDAQAPSRLTFTCTDSGGCVLTQVWDSRGLGVQFPKPKLTSAEKERLAVVYLKPAKIHAD